jgi:predicted ATPase
MFLSLIHHLRRDATETKAQAEAAIAFSTEQRFPFLVLGSTIYRGWALTEQGQEEEGLTQICQGLDAYRATGAGLSLPYFFALLAEACGKVRRADKGLRIL